MFRHSITGPIIKRFLHEGAAVKGKKKIIARYTDVFPVTLFRISGKSTNVVLREFAVQQAKNSKSFDLTLAPDGLVHPAPLDNTFIGPNGASLRPRGPNMWDVLLLRSGITNVIEIPAGIKIPEKLVLLHEHGDHYSLQCTEPMTRKALEKIMNEFIKTGKSGVYSKEEYFQKYPVDEL